MKFILATTRMIQSNINSKTCFFTVDHITKEKNNKLIYGISINNSHYFLSKTSGVNDGAQLDNNLPLPNDMLKELNEVITEIEIKHTKRQSLEHINSDIFSILSRLRNLRLKQFERAIL
ncbi:MAG: hypothetical protein JWR50_3213 [Mucilaginibacter sp.]|nr:hypothetical protein [Mucilaginibacter sp.]